MHRQIVVYYIFCIFCGRLVLADVDENYSLASKDNLSTTSFMDTQHFVKQYFCLDLPGTPDDVKSISSDELASTVRETIKVLNNVKKNYKKERLPARELNKYSKSHGIIPVTLFPTGLKEMISHQKHPTLFLYNKLLNAMLKAYYILDFLEYEDRIINGRRYNQPKFSYQLARLRRTTDQAGIHNIICTLYKLINHAGDNLTIDDLTVKPLLTESELQQLEFTVSTHERHRRSVTHRHAVRTYLFFQELNGFLRRSLRLLNRP